MNQNQFNTENIIPVSAIIIAQNEERNIKGCLQSLSGYFDDIWVVDSHSHDNTREISKIYGAKVLTNHFLDWAAQRNWALVHAKLKHEWIFFIDADERVTPAFCEELRTMAAKAPKKVGGMNVRFQFYFLNQPLRYAYEPLPVLRVVRRGKASWQGKGAREYARVEGELLTLQNKLVHWDQKGLADWISKQTRNALREVALITSQATGNQCNETLAGAGISQERPGRRLLREKVWNRLPHFGRGFAYFFYRYFLKRGFLDGKAGFAYCFLHGLWVPLLIDMMLEEKLDGNPNASRNL